MPDIGKIYQSEPVPSLWNRRPESTHVQGIIIPVDRFAACKKSSAGRGEAFVVAQAIASLIVSLLISYKHVPYDGHGIHKYASKPFTHLW
jgi:hypothetical protein